MLSLREIQSGFARALFSGMHGPSTPGIRADGLSPALRLGFYRTNVFANYLDALRATFVVVERAVGRAHFSTLAERFVRDYPSTHGDLNRYGGEFAHFLKGQAVTIDLPWLPDLAQLEWLIDESFYAADHSPLSLERLALVPAEDYAQLVFRLHPACRLQRSDYPILHIWEAGRAGERDIADVTPSREGHGVLLRRVSFEVVIEAVEPATFAMLDALRSGASFGQAYERVLVEHPAFDPGPFLQRYVGNCALVDFRLASRACSDEESFNDA